MSNNNTVKGILLIITGSILLLHTLGILVQWLNTILITGSIIMIIYGIVLAGYHKKVFGLFGKKEEPEWRE